MKSIKLLGIAILLASSANFNLKVATAQTRNTIVLDTHQKDAGPKVDKTSGSGAADQTHHDYSGCFDRLGDWSEMLGDISGSKPDYPTETRERAINKLRDSAIGSYCGLMTLFDKKSYLIPSEASEILAGSLISLTYPSEWRKLADPESDRLALRVGHALLDIASKYPGNDHYSRSSMASRCFDAILYVENRLTPAARSELLGRMNVIIQTENDRHDPAGVIATANKEIPEMSKKIQEFQKAFEKSGFDGKK